MLHRIKPVLAVMAIVGLVAAGCGGSSGTPTPPPISDPNEIITKSMTAAANATSLHIRINVSGKVSLAGIGESAGGLSGNIDLAGTNVEGDVDVKKQAADLKFAMPGLLGLSGHIIVVDGYSYMQMSLQGDKYVKSKLDDSLPVDMPSPGASASGEILRQVEEIKKALDDAGAKAILKGNEKVDGRDCYLVVVEIPASKLNELLGEAGQTTAGMNIESTTVDYYVYKDNLRPAKIFLSATVTSVGTLSLEAIITKYDQAVSVKAPDASQIQEATPAA